MKTAAGPGESHRPGPKMILLMLMAALIAALITGPALYRTCRVRGWLPGATVTTETITKTWIEASTRVRGWGSGTSTVYWVSWAKDGDATAPGSRTNLDHDAWAKLHAGDSVAVIRVGGDERPCLRHDASDTNGELAINLSLFAAELAIALYVAVRLLRARRRAAP